MPKNKRTEFKKYSDQFVDFNFVIVKEDKEKQTSKAEVYLEGFKVREPKGSNIEEILSKFENRMFAMMTDFKSEVKSDINEVKSDMVKMEERINDKIDETNLRIDKVENQLKADIVKLDSKIDNFKDEMNDRFDKLESRVSTLEGFHKKDLDKK